MRGGRGGVADDQEDLEMNRADFAAMMLSLQESPCGRCDVRIRARPRNVPAGRDSSCHRP